MSGSEDMPVQQSIYFSKIVFLSCRSVTFVLTQMVATPLLLAGSRRIKASMLSHGLVRTHRTTRLIEIRKYFLEVVRAGVTRPQAEIPGESTSFSCF